MEVLFPQMNPVAGVGVAADASAVDAVACPGVAADAAAVDAVACAGISADIAALDSIPGGDVSIDRPAGHAISGGDAAHDISAAAYGKLTGDVQGGAIIAELHPGFFPLAPLQQGLLLQLSADVQHGPQLPVVLPGQIRHHRGRLLPAKEGVQGNAEQIRQPGQQLNIGTALILLPFGHSLIGDPQLLGQLLELFFLLVGHVHHGFQLCKRCFCTLQLRRKLRLLRLNYWRTCT